MTRGEAFLAADRAQSLGVGLRAAFFVKARRSWSVVVVDTITRRRFLVAAEDDVDLIRQRLESEPVQ